MPLSTLNYQPSLRRSPKPVHPDYERLEHAFALAEEGRDGESLQMVLSHLFPATRIPDLTREAFRFTQGSSHVSVQVEADMLKVQVPLVRLPTGSSAIAALRYVVTHISGSGQLYQPRLHGDDVYLEFREPVAHIHPSKLVEVLRRMPAQADTCDDWLIGQFAATALEREAVGPLTLDELSCASALWTEHWSDVQMLLAEVRRKRSVFLLNEVTAYAINRVEFALPLCGMLSSRIEEAASIFNDSENDPPRRDAALAKCAKEMLSVSQSELANSLGHVEYAISRLSAGTPADVTSLLGSAHYRQSIDRLRTSGQSLDAALALISTYLYYLARFSWPEAIESELKAGLAAASGKPWRDAARLLWEHSREFVARFGEAREDDGGEDSDGAHEGNQ